ncbi:hypothetical protein [Streptomyces triculaminicus]|uniref:hypothetical protein n=1 Tax=Streptomyces triculaminicus TaxID=2816232 RepID=UPI003557A94A
MGGGGGAGVQVVEDARYLDTGADAAVRLRDEAASERGALGLLVGVDAEGVVGGARRGYFARPPPGRG